MGRPALMAVVGLAAVLVRLGDSACGCAAHNRWFECVELIGGSDHAGHHDHVPADTPACDHGCECVSAGYDATRPSAPAVDRPATASGPGPSMLRVDVPGPTVEPRWQVPGKSPPTAVRLSQLRVMLV